MKILLGFLLLASAPVLAQTTTPTKSAEAEAVIDKATAGVLPVTDSARVARKRSAAKTVNVPGKSRATRNRRLRARQRQAAEKQ